MSEKISKTVLANFTPLDALNPENLTEIAAKLETHSIPASKIVFRHGDSLKQHFYLLEGEVEMIDADNNVVGTVEGGSSEARSALSLNNPQHVSVRTKSKSKIISVNRDLLDIMLTWDQTGSYQVLDLDNYQPESSSSSSNEESHDWMTHILQTKAFHRIPPANIQAMFMRMEAVSYSKGDVVVTQNEPGDYFYTITQGKCDVSRSSGAGSDAVKLATLGPGDSFGEEALISDATRNATVTMATDGSMMRLSKEDFISLLNEPLLSWVDYTEGVQKIAKGAEWIDVRLPAEFKSGHIPGSNNIPLIFLRMKMNTLDQDKEYIVYCDTSRRSSAASFLLSEKGFANVHTLADGLSGVPENILAR
ncbi:MAG: cyclic nucleotide-binding domain-containing protein [Pseudomonadota bacterium]